MKSKIERMCNELNLEKWDELQKLFDEYLKLIVTDGHYKTRDGRIDLTFHYDWWEERTGWYLFYSGYVNSFHFEAETPEGAIQTGIDELKELIDEKNSR